LSIDAPTESDYVFSKGQFTSFVSSHCFRHTYRSWLDALGSPTGLQQRMMRHSSIITTANYGDTVPSDLRQAHEKVVQRALRHGNGTEGSATH